MNTKKISMFLFVVASVAVCLMVTQCLRARSADEEVGDVVMERFTRLVLELEANKQTNTLMQVTELLNAKNTLEDTKEAAISVGLLELLRSGRTNEAIDRLEIFLDVALGHLGRSTNEIREAQLNILKLAKDYRTRFPRKTDHPIMDDGVARAFELLDKKKSPH